jgi:hypothetical protein
MAWLGHCLVNIRNVLRSLPSAGQLMLVSDLREFLDREERDIRQRNYAHAISATYRNQDGREDHRHSRRREFVGM